MVELIAVEKLRGCLVSVSGGRAVSLQKPTGQPSPTSSISSARRPVGPLRLYGSTVMTKHTPTARVTVEQSDVVLFGLDETGKPRAARFSGEHTDLAARAAGLMNLTICRVGGGGAFTLPPSARSNGSCSFPASRFPVWTPRGRQEHSDARHQADQTYKSLDHFTQPHGRLSSCQVPYLVFEPVHRPRARDGIQIEWVGLGGPLVGGHPKSLAPLNFVPEELEPVCYVYDAGLLRMKADAAVARLGFVALRPGPTTRDTLSRRSAEFIL